MTDRDLLKKVDKKRQEQGLTVWKIGYLLGFSDAYYSKLFHGKRRVTENVRKEFIRYLSGDYDRIEVPEYARDNEQAAHKKGYKKAMKDLHDFLETKKTEC